MKTFAVSCLLAVTVAVAATDALAVTRPPLAAQLRSTTSSTALTTTTAIQLSGGGGGGGAAEGSGVGTATIPNEVFNLVKSIVGAGVLSLPYGVAVFGNAPSALIPAVTLIALMGALSAYTFGLIGRICQRTNTESYADAWDASVGKKWSPLIAFSCFIDCFAGNLSYSMILADTIKNLAASAGYAVTRTNALLGVTGLVLLPLCLLKNLASLAPFSLVGIVGMLYTTAAMGLRWYQQSYAPGGAFFASQLSAPVFGTSGAAAAMTNPSTLILACMLSNAYIAHFNAPKFLKELKNNTMSRFHQVIAWSFGTSIALYGLITAFGFLTFGTLIGQDTIVLL
jgi:amino acid permease